MARNGKDNIGKGVTATTAERTAALDALGRQSALIDLSYEPIFVWEWNAGIIQWNTGAERLYGFTKAEVLGKVSHRILNTTHAVPFEEYLRILETEGYWAGQLCHITNDGREVIVASRQQLVTSEGRQLVLESNRDITERRAAADRIALLAVIGETIRMSAESAPMLFAISKAVGEHLKVRRCLFNEIDLENDIETVRGDYCRGLESIAGKHKISAYSPVTSSNMKAGQTVVNSDSKIDPRTAKYYKKTYEPTGERSYVAVPLMRDSRWVASLWVSDDQPRSWTEADVALLETVAERSWFAVEKLRNDEVSERYRLLSERSTDIIWFIRPDGTFVDVNSAAIATYGYTRNEFLRLNLSDIRHSSTRSEIGEQLRSAGSAAIHFETIHIRKDGTELPVEVRANAADLGGERLIVAIVRDISERKKHEDALLESEKRRQLAQEAGNVGIFDWDIAGGTTYWSETMWTFYGEGARDIDPDEAYWSSHLHPDDRERVKANIQNVTASGGDEFRDEFRIVRNDGSFRWIDAVAKISRDSSGAATRMHGVNIDITLRKQAEEKVRLSENQLRLVTNALPALISYVDKDGSYRFGNEKYAEWFGVDPEQISGMAPRDVFGLQAYEVLKPHIDAALSGQPRTFETVLSYKDIGDRYVNVSYIPDVGADGTVHGYYGLTHDLSDLKRSEELLRSSEERLALMMESLTDYAIFSMDADGRIDSWTNGAKGIFGYSRDEVLGKHCDIIYTPEDIGLEVPAREMGIARQKGRAFDERWLVRKDGTRFFASGVMMALHIGKTLTGYAKIASDLTEKKRHAEELQRAHDDLEIRVRERTKELAETNLALMQEMEDREVAEKQRIDLLRRLVSSQELERRRIARDLHDQLGQRLTALRLKIESLRELSADNEQFSQRVQRLQEIAEKVDAEVSFLAWELRPSALDDLGLVQAVAAFVSEWSRHYETPAEFHSAGLSKVRLSNDAETHLYRITQEALNNIAKHASANSVTVLLEKRDENVILIIEDDGVGFDPGEISAPSESGQGLGLIGMRERANLIGGDVEIESAPGMGATIFVRVPISG